jgi:hypothetical protein
MRQVDDHLGEGGLLMANQIVPMPLAAVISVVFLALAPSVGSAQLIGDRRHS